MTNNNDGKWHGWNGGECPVNPETVVDVALDNGALVKGESANKWFWDTDNTCIIAFRVIKEYRELRGFWITMYDGMAWDNEEAAIKHNIVICGNESQIIHVREVNQ